MDIGGAAEEWLKKAREMTATVAEMPRAGTQSTDAPGEKLRREYETAEMRRQVIIIDYLLMLVSKPPRGGA